MSGNRKKLIAFNYFGGKFTYVDEIVSYFPSHQHFVDVFCGSMAVTLNKPYSQVDTANDIHQEVINFFRILRNKPVELLTLLKLTPVSRDEFNSCFDTSEAIDELERARRFYVRMQQCFFNLGLGSGNKGWHFVTKGSEALHGETVSKWHNAIRKMGPIIDKLTHIQIDNKDFRILMPQVDGPDTLLYQDPPYPEESRASKNDYQFEFTNNDHIDLADLNKKALSKVMISSYDCALMNELYPPHLWKKIKLKQKMNNIRASKVQECIWVNYEPPVQLSLFQNKELACI
jgi:DNA adenine methylase